MKAYLKLFFGASLCLVTAAASQAGQEGTAQPPQPSPAQDAVHFSYTSSFWLPSTELDISVPNLTVAGRTIGGEISVDQPWWETLSKFSSDFYVLSISGRLEAWKGRWGGFVDGYWIF